MTATAKRAHTRAMTYRYPRIADGAIALAREDARKANANMPTPKNPRPNQYAGDCNRCGAPVAAGAGILLGKMIGGSGRWLVAHTECPKPITTADELLDWIGGEASDGWPCEIHGAGDDECVMGRRGKSCITTPRRSGSTLGATGGCFRHGDVPFDPAVLNGCWECDMEAAIAKRDAEEGR